jgi:SAM-dependent methyltransferase
MSLVSKLAYLQRRLTDALKPRVRFIADRERKLGRFDLVDTCYRTDYVKEEISRQYVFAHPGEVLNFLDVGARDGALTYLLGIRKDLVFDEQFYREQLAAFRAKYQYFGMDLLPADDAQVLSGDACAPDYLERNPAFLGKFDVIYSNNVFEHFQRPWIAAANLEKLLKPGGLMITIVPFAQRYHESPGDYFRYTHKGVESLFQSVGAFDVLESGYDLCGRRTNWQGSGHGNDIVPTDHFGAWRETWFTVSILRKIKSTSPPS